MVIVYLSIALVVAAIIGLGIYTFRIFKQCQPSLKELADISGRMQQRVDDINKEKTDLMTTVEDIKGNVDDKKTAVQSVVSASKGTIETVKGLWGSVRELPNPRKVPRTEMAPEMHDLVDNVVALWERIRYWKK